MGGDEGNDDERRIDHGYRDRGRGHRHFGGREGVDGIVLQEHVRVGGKGVGVQGVTQSATSVEGYKITRKKGVRGYDEAETEKVYGRLVGEEVQDTVNMYCSVGQEINIP